VARDYYAASENTGRIVAERSADTSFVLSNASAVLAAIPGAAGKSQADASAHLVGFSVGGAVATVTAERDSRVRTVVNLDGGLYGSRDARAILAPYLMMYSAANAGLNDELLPAHAERVTPNGTKHLNYHELAALLPLLRYTGVTGTTNPATFVAQRNRAVRAFLARTAALEPGSRGSAALDHI
jgi:dienelactone hydrolase